MGRSVRALPDAVQITAEPFVAMVDLRVDPTGAGGAAVAAYLGVARCPPRRRPTSRARPPRPIWLGPDEWLVTSPFRTPEELETGLREASGRRAVARSVDVSAQRTTLRLRGEHARDLLARGCSVDLHPRVFGRGSRRADHCSVRPASS